MPIPEMRRQWIIDRVPVRTVDVTAGIASTDLDCSSDPILQFTCLAESTIVLEALGDTAGTSRSYKLVPGVTFTLPTQKVVRSGTSTGTGIVGLR